MRVTPLWHRWERDICLNINQIAVGKWKKKRASYLHACISNRPACNRFQVEHFGLGLWCILGGIHRGWRTREDMAVDLWAKLWSALMQKLYNTESYPYKEKPTKESSHLIILVVPSFLVIKKRRQVMSCQDYRSVFYLIQKQPASECYHWWGVYMRIHTGGLLRKWPSTSTDKGGRQSLCYEIHGEISNLTRRASHPAAQGGMSTPSLGPRKWDPKWHSWASRYHQPVRQKTHLRSSSAFQSCI